MFSLLSFYIYTPNAFNIQYWSYPRERPFCCYYKHLLKFQRDILKKSQDCCVVCRLYHRQYFSFQNLIFQSKVPENLYLIFCLQLYSWVYSLYRSQRLQQKEVSEQIQNNTQATKEIQIVNTSSSVSRYPMMLMPMLMLMVKMYSTSLYYVCMAMKI